VGIVERMLLNEFSELQLQTVKSEDYADSPTAVSLYMLQSKERCSCAMNRAQMEQILLQHNCTPLINRSLHSVTFRVTTLQVM